MNRHFNVRRGVILRINERVNLSLNLPRYGSFNQILVASFAVSVIVASLLLLLDTGGDGLNCLISLEVNLRGKPFQESKT
jgi:hypothetical protein